MDETDLRLCKLLACNSRIPYREIGDHIGISLQAVHRRVQDMIEEGVIEKFYALPTERGVKAMCVFLFGVSESPSLDGMLTEVGEEEHISSVYFAGGNLVYIAAFLRDMSELEGLSEFVRRVGRIPDLQIGIPPVSGSNDTKEKGSGTKPLTELEMRILDSLRNDCRKPSRDIASEVGVSVKTVKKHLDRMVKDRLVLFTMSWFPAVEGNIISIFRVKIKPAANKNTAGAAILTRFDPFIMDFVPMVNIPDTLFCVVWTPSLKKVTELQVDVENLDTVESVITDIIYNAKRFDTWIDRTDGRM